MNIEYTRHAELKIAKRKLSKADIASVLDSPDAVLDARESRRVAQGMVGKYLLRVVFEPHGDTCTVVTAYYAKPERYR